MASPSNDPAMELSESIGMMTTQPIVEVDDTFASDAGAGFRTALNSAPNTPNVRQNLPQVNEELENISNISDGGSGNNNDDHFQIYGGINHAGTHFYQPLFTSALPLPPLPINVPVEASMPRTHRTEYKFEVGVLTEGPGGIGIWYKHYFTAEILYPFNLVRSYQNEEGVFIYKFTCTEHTNQGSMNEEVILVPSLSAPVRGDLTRNQSRSPLVPVHVVNLGGRTTQPSNGVRAQQTVTGRTATTEHVQHMEPTRYPYVNTYRRPPKQTYHEALASRPYVPGAYDPFAADEELLRKFAPNSPKLINYYSGNVRNNTNNEVPVNARHGYNTRGNTYYTPPVSGVPATTFHSVANGSTAWQNNPMRNDRNPPPEEAAVERPNNTHITNEIYTVSESPITFKLRSLSLADVYTFTKQVKAHDARYVNNPRRQYKVTQAIDEVILRHVIAGTSLSYEDLATMDSKHFLRLLKTKAHPDGTKQFLEVFKSKEVLTFVPQYEYDIRNKDVRHDYLRDIQAFLTDCGNFFTFLTEDMTPAELNNLPPMKNKRDSRDGLVEITMSKIPGIDGDTSTHYARSILNAPQNHSLFDPLLDANTLVEFAYPRFVHDLSLLLNSSLHLLDSYMLEDKRFNPTVRMTSHNPLHGKSSNAISNSASNNKHSDLVAKYNSRKKEIWTAPDQLNMMSNAYDTLSVHTEEEPASDSIELPEAVDPYFAPLYHVYDNCFYAMDAPDHEKRIRREVFAKALEPAGPYYKKRGEEGYIGSLPTVCLRFIRTGKCNSASCKYSHQWKDYLEFAAAIQADYRRVKDAAVPNPVSNNAAPKTIPQSANRSFQRPTGTGTEKLQQHTTRVQSWEDEDLHDSDDHGDIEAPDDQEEA